MLNENNDRLREAVLTCKMHAERMNFAFSRIEALFPLTVEQYAVVSNENISFIDQFIYRFSKLQDAMGSKLFKALLDCLGEETRGVPFIDILSKLEALNIVEDGNDWLMLREIRNMLAHEYPFNTEEIIEGLNLLRQHFALLIAIWSQLEKYTLSKFPHLFPESR